VQSCASTELHAGVRLGTFSLEQGSRGPPAVRLASFALKTTRDSQDKYQNAMLAYVKMLVRVSPSITLLYFEKKNGPLGSNAAAHVYMLWTNFEDYTSQKFHGVELQLKVTSAEGRAIHFSSPATADAG
jgi:hypothetical protein